jgi:drug/metabolite transporter (DMT)-like permease
VTPTRTKGALLGLAAAASFGLSTPLAKLLLTSIPPVLLAGLLYLGAAAGLWLHRLVRPASSEARLDRDDVPTLALVAVAGGILGPVAMLFGLGHVTAFAGSLLLNLEAPFTMLLAVAVFGEHLGRRAGAAAVLILGGAAVLGFEPGALGGDTTGVVLLAAACLCWAIDNNLTQRLSGKDPFAIVRVKTLVAGVCNTTLGLLLSGGGLPASKYVVGALALGSVSYGVSVLLDSYALRLLGAAREAAYFATAPFVGALGALVLLREPLQGLDVGAMLGMGAGVALLIRERHGHLHAHDPLEHEHLHVHDEHHRHEHGPGDPAGDPHTHRHRHVRLVHDHPHLPDVHHRHHH